MLPPTAVPNQWLCKMISAPRTLPFDLHVTSPCEKSLPDSLPDVVSGTDDSDHATAVSAIGEKPANQASDDPPPKKKRGRPRKRPVTVPSPEAKIPRSKTGCLTCRRRKKKCDETKPECQNCQKTLATCEGYPLPQKWQSSRVRSDARRISDLPATIDGIENEEDRMLFEHFHQNLGHILCLTRGLERTPSFTEIIIPMSYRDVGLMHSMLCLSGYQLASSSVKSQIPDLSRKKVAARSHYHWEKASELLMSKMTELRKAKTQGTQLQIDDTLVAQAICLCLKTTIAGDHYGDYKAHLNGIQRLILENNYTCSLDPFRVFALEFVLYNRVAANLTSLDRSYSLPTSIYQQFMLSLFAAPAAGAFLGVIGGLLIILSKITALRDRKRTGFNAHRTSGAPPPEALIILEELRVWVPSQSQLRDGALYTISLLYRIATWIYLRRSFSPSASPTLSEKLDEGLSLLSKLLADESIQPVLLMPVFLLGVGCFEPPQRQQIVDTFATLEHARGCGNIKLTRLVVQQVWGLMDAGDENNWDWESLMVRMGPDGVDFLVT